MTIFYSKSKTGFFDSDIHGSSIPDDCVEVSKESYQVLMDGQCVGKVITANEEGVPMLMDRLPPSEAEEISRSNKLIIDQITSIEKNLQPRAIRDMLLYEDITRLLDIEDQIKLLRAQLR